jgi:VWFA-related protein
MILLMFLWMPLSQVLLAKQNAPPPTDKEKDAATRSQFPAKSVKVNVNVVEVRVVVRDEQGKTVANLKKEDFALFDNQKRQAIITFSPEIVVKPITDVPSHSPSVSKEDKPAVVASFPERFVGLYIDDIHIEEGNIPQVREAAMKLVDAMGATDRLAIFVSSGQLSEDFTSDRQKLTAALQKLAPHPMGGRSALADCPPMTFYEAYEITQVNDPAAIEAANEDFRECMSVASADDNEHEIWKAATRAVEIGKSGLNLVLQNLGSVIHRMSVLPGQRVIVMLSPGFFVMPLMQESHEIIDRATKAGIVVNTIDARGLYTSTMYSASSSGAMSVAKAQFMQTEESEQGDVLAGFAESTGGQYFHNRNDIDQGLLEAAAPPQFSYVLGFSPQNLRYDGKFHTLKVGLTIKSNWRVQARRGYFAPRKPESPQQDIRQQMEHALTSPKEIQELPLQLQVQITKTGQLAQLSAISHIDTRNAVFERANNTNNDDLKIVLALFDLDGRLVSVTERSVSLHVPDTTLNSWDKTGIRVKVDVNVHPGTYLVRVVVRDSGAGEMGATSQGVVVPN